MVVLTDRQKILIDDYNDMAMIYSILCLKTSNYYGKLKYLVDIPVIIISASMSLINSKFDEGYVLQVSNIVCNILIVTLLSINNFMKISEKRQMFKVWNDRFARLSHKIEEKKLMNKIDEDFISNIIAQYENLVEGIDVDLPDFIKQSVRNEYKEKKSLPIIINNVHKLMENRDIELLGIHSGNNSPTNNERVPLKSALQQETSQNTARNEVGSILKTEKNVSFENYFIEKENTSNISTMTSPELVPTAQVIKVKSIKEENDYC